LKKKNAAMKNYPTDRRKGGGGEEEVALEGVKERRNGTGSPCPESYSTRGGVKKVSGIWKNVFLRREIPGKRPSGVFP